MRDEKSNRIRLDDSIFHTVLYSPTCIWCIHFDISTSGPDDANRRCDAFDLIPFEIWNGMNNHHSPYPGDHGILFEDSRGEFPKEH